MARPIPDNHDAPRHFRNQPDPFARRQRVPEPPHRNEQNRVQENWAPLYPALPQPYARWVLTLLMVCLLGVPTLILLGRECLRGIRRYACETGCAQPAQPRVANDPEDADGSTPPRANTDTPPILDQVVAVAIRNPYLTPHDIYCRLRKRAAQITEQDVVQALEVAHLESEAQRVQNTERMFIDGTLSLDSRDVAYLESRNPCLADRKRLPDRPGARLELDVIAVSVQGLGDSVYLVLAVDSFCGYASVCPIAGYWLPKAPDYMDRYIFAGYSALGLTVEAVSSDFTSRYGPVRTRSLNSFLEGAGIEHYALKRFAQSERSSFLNQFRARFARGFLQERVKGRRFVDLASFEDALGMWLMLYNASRNDVGFPNWGASPLERLQEYEDRK